MYDLERFRTAQASATNGFAAAIGELRAGRKRGHWIWYIFPQLAGLGHSSTSMLYGLDGAGEAQAYLQDDELRARLVAAAEIVAARLRLSPAPAIEDLMGSDIDAQKLVSSMTLFRGVAERLRQTDDAVEYRALAAAADTIVSVAAAQGFPACAFTRARLDVGN